MIKDTFRWLESRVEPGGEWRSETGFPTLDQRDGGIQRRELTLVAGSSLLALRAFVTSVAAHVAADQKVPVLLLTMRREGARSAMRFLGQRSGLDPRRLQRGKVTSEDQWLKLMNAAYDLSDVSIVFDETPYRELELLRRRIHESVQSRSVGLVIVEELDGLVDDGAVTIFEVCSVLADLAREEGVTVLASLRTPAPRRKPVGSGQATPDRAMLRLARHVDALWFLARHGREVELIVAKGPTGAHRVPLVFDDAAAALQERPAPVRARTRRSASGWLFTEGDPARETR